MTAEPFVGIRDPERLTCLRRLGLLDTPPEPAISARGVVAYAGIPLVTAEGLAVGAFCVIDHQPRAWTQDELALLQDLAAAAMTEIELRALAQERAELLTREQAARAEVESVRQTVLNAVSHELLTPLSI